MRGEARVEIGGVARAHGIRGEIVVFTHDPDSDTLGNLESIYVGGVERKILAARDTQRGWLLKLDGVVTRNDAEALQGKVVEIDRSMLDLDAEDVLLHDMVGCEARLPDGTPWGRVYAVDLGEFQDLVVIHAEGTTPDQVIERLLPLIDDYVTAIDLDGGFVTVDPPEGLPESIVKKKK